MDLSKFFDKCQHDALLLRVARKIDDKRILRVIGNFLRAGVMVEREHQPSHEGVMQGSPLSPLLSNILLDDLDKELEKRGLPFVRYADDFLIFTKTRIAAERVFQSVERYLASKLKLVVNRDKSRVCSTKGVEFLSYRFDGYSGYIEVSPKSLFGRLDKWLRRRLRACIWKQWRLPRTRIRKLTELGVPKKEAISHGNSRKGPWRMSRSLALSMGMSVAWLADLGLFNLLKAWKELASKRRTAPVLLCV
jgi:RNA-directed DNA polymerase